MMDMQHVQNEDIKSSGGLPEVEIPEVDVISPSQAGKKVVRPVSALSRASTTSISSKRSQNTILSKYTIDTFYSYREGCFESAVSDCKTNALTKEDGDLIDSWLLLEIDQWDCEQERIVLLTQNSLITVRYDFVKNRVYKMKRVELKKIKSIKDGELVYPSGSLMTPRDHGGVRVAWDKEENAGFFARWNFAGDSSMPYWTFAHHKLIYMQGEEENARYNVDEFHDALVEQVREVLRAQQKEDQLKVEQCDITISSYVSLTSLIYNQSSLGFSKDRRGVNY